MTLNHLNEDTFSIAKTNGIKAALIDHFCYSILFDSYKQVNRMEELSESYKYDIYICV